MKFTLKAPNFGSNQCSDLQTKHAQLVRIDAKRTLMEYTHPYNVTKIMSLENAFNVVYIGISRYILYAYVLYHAKTR